MTTGEQPPLTITIPCYRQLDLLRQCLESILTQTFGDFVVYLLDDGDSDAYRDYVTALGDRRVHYLRNPERMGAMRNIFQAIFFGRSRYVLAFHEDDLMESRYLEAAVGMLEERPRCGFVASELEFFSADGRPPPNEPDTTPHYVVFEDARAFLRAIFAGAQPMFGSVVYRRSAIEGVSPVIEELGTLCDRPFLLDILRSWHGALLTSPAAWCRAHGTDDDRHGSLRPGHVLRFLRALREPLQTPLVGDDRRLFHAYADYSLRELHPLIPPEHRPKLRSLVWSAWRDGTYKPGALGLRGMARVVGAMVS